MAVILKIICGILLIGVTHGWTLSTENNNNNSSTWVSILNDMDRMVAMMNERFQRYFGFSTSPMEDRKQLDAIEPVCTTTTTTTGSMQKTRRRNFRPTQTITCTKELILNGKKQFYKEINITNDKGILISQSKMYQTIIINSPNNTANVISY